MATYYTLSELAAIAGVPASTVNFYKHHGLLPPSYKAGRGANYGEEHLERMRKIAAYRQLGYSLGAIRAIFENRVDPLPLDAELRAAGVKKGVDAGKIERADTRNPLFPDPNNTQTSVSQVYGVVKLFPGLDLHYELGRYHVYPQAVEELREALRAILCAGMEEM